MTTAATALTHGGKRPGAGRKAEHGPRVKSSMTLATDVREYLNTLPSGGVAIDDAVRRTSGYKKWLHEKDSAK